MKNTDAPHFDFERAVRIGGECEERGGKRSNEEDPPWGNVMVVMKETDGKQSCVMVMFGVERISVKRSLGQGGIDLE